MSTKKTIQINPELFKLPGNKTKKAKERKQLAINPVVSPNNLKNKLLKRIKEHKTQELKPSTRSTSPTTTDKTYTDEFYGAIDYLSGLTKKQKQQKILHNKTIKKPITQPTSNPLLGEQISLELPPELEEPIINSKYNEVFNVNYKPVDDVPYGCLKNGNKKTYREWKELSKTESIPELPSMIRPPTPPKKNQNIASNNISGSQINSSSQISREQRLEQIKEKLKKIQDQELTAKIDPIDKLPELDDKEVSLTDILKIREEKIEKENPKQYLKKTVKRKFTLGKSDKLRRVSVLIKDRQTRKNVIDTQKALKKTNITDVRKYLRQHGIIKVGSTCPNDILRKTFESAMLAGEVTNTNKETLLHNLLNEDLKT
jgi:hypothetical protein